MGRDPGPLVPELGVLALVEHEWQPWWLETHHFLVALARYCPITWVNPARHWRQLRSRPRLPRRPAGVPADLDGFEVYDAPAWLAHSHRPARLARMLFEARLATARRLLLRRGCRRIVLSLWRPEFACALSCVPHDLSVYHIADEYSFSAEDAPTSEAEQRLIESVDQVFVHSPALLEKKGRLNPETVLIPNGVDYASYARPYPEPADLTPIPRPRIGYVGFLKTQLEWHLVRQLAETHPEWSFVFVGPRADQPDIAAAIRPVSERRNAFFLGARAAWELPPYPQHFDVCVMPYKTDGYTKYIYPLKLHEYLASGRPVVGSPIRSLLDFGDVIHLAGTPDEWSAALTKALMPDANGPCERERRQDVARRHDWKLLAARAASILADRLGQPLPDTVRALADSFEAE